MSEASIRRRGGIRSASAPPTTMRMRPRDRRRHEHARRGRGRSRSGRGRARPARRSGTGRRGARRPGRSRRAGSRAGRAAAGSAKRLVVVGVAASMSLDHDPHGVLRRRRRRRGPGRSRRRRWPRGCGRPSTPTARGCGDSAARPSASGTRRLTTLRPPSVTSTRIARPGPPPGDVAAAPAGRGPSDVGRGADPRRARRGSGPASSAVRRPSATRRRTRVQGVVRHRPASSSSRAASRRVASSTSISPRSSARRMARLGSTVVVGVAGDVAAGRRSTAAGDGIAGAVRGRSGARCGASGPARSTGGGRQRRPGRCAGRRRWSGRSGRRAAGADDHASAGRAAPRPGRRRRHGRRR